MIRLQRILSKNNKERLNLEFAFARKKNQDVKKAADNICGELSFLIQNTQFSSIDDRIEMLMQSILAPPLKSMNRPQVEMVSLSFIHSGDQIRRVKRTKEHFRCQQESSIFGSVEILYETKECGVYRLIVNPGKSIPTHVHTILEEHELVLSGGFSLQGKPIEEGLAFSWPKEHAHRYDNLSSDSQVILCVDCPSFFHADEVEVSIPIKDLIEISSKNYYRDHS